ncbi:hypothetical protein [Novosphingobium resinovorum]|uniref:hypothetical protein n=1 Tax=Novosphingobium resinovorum TaxID=158500 RepID=UPI0012E9B147|nr:hypothetical protein [Novosphingobium resinovorum]
MANEAASQSESSVAHPEPFLAFRRSPHVAWQRITAPLEPFCLNGGIVAKKLSDADFGFPKLRFGRFATMIAQPSEADQSLEDRTNGKTFCAPAR